MKLVILNGPGSGKAFPLKEGLILTRTAQKKEGVFIEDPLASSPHAQVVKSKGDLYLKDMNSKNGTYVKGKINDWFSLHPGRKFQIGTTWLEVKSPPQPLSWPARVEKELNKNLPQIKDGFQEIKPFKRSVILDFQSGIQKSQSWRLGYGPRVAGKASLDLPLLDPLSPDICFFLCPGEGNEVVFKTPCPEEVSLNGESHHRFLLQNQDQISFGGTCIKIRYIP